MEDILLDEHTNFGQLIAQQRANLGMSQAEACRRSGVAPDAWSRLEAGKYVQVTMRTGMAALKALGMRIKLEAHFDKES